MTGTIINVATVILGSVLGLLLGNRLPDRLRQTVMSGLGLFVLANGLQMFLSTQNSLIVLGGLLIGALLGELLRIEEGLQKLGQLLEKRFLSGQANGSGGADTRFVRGFLTASLLFCIGPMAIMGSIQDGLTGNFQILVVKAVLDGFAALAFASTLGAGVMFSALMILLYQGGISLLAFQANALITTRMMNELNATGGVILMGLALSSLLEIRKIRVGSFLPALAVAPLIVAILVWFGK
jgi:uncharacterized protein